MSENKQMPSLPCLIGEVSRYTGVHIETIRYYERIAVMPEPARSPGKQRLYARPQLQRLEFIRKSRDLGFSLEEIRSLLSLADNNTLTCKQVETITGDHLDGVQQKIRDLQSIECALKEMLSQCTGSDVPDCPVFDTLYGAYSGVNG